MVLTVPRIQLDAMQFSLLAAISEKKKLYEKLTHSMQQRQRHFWNEKNTPMSDKNFTCFVFFLFPVFHTCVLCLPSPTANNRVQSSRSQLFRECLGTSQWESSFAGSSEIRLDQFAELQPRSSRNKSWPRGDRSTNGKKTTHDEDLCSAQRRETNLFRFQLKIYDCFKCKWFPAFCSFAIYVI